MPRRRFLGLSGAAAGVALLEGCVRQETQFIEQALRRGPSHPGQEYWQRSICQQCTGGCEIRVRMIDGRVKKIEGDVGSSVNSGGVCALGHSALQDLYHPQRWLQPSQRQGDGTWRSVEWEGALDTLAERFAKAVGTPGSMALCCGPDPTERALVQGLANALGASVTIVESPHAAVEREARRQFFGADVDLLYDLSCADFVWTSGASILDRWGNPVYFAGAVADARARGVRFAVASQRLSLTAAKADLWLPVRGSAAPLFRAVSEASRGIEVNLEAVADSVGVPLERLEQLVKAVGEAQHPALIVGAEGGESVADVIAGFRLQKELGVLPAAIDIGALMGTEALRKDQQAEVQSRTLEELRMAVEDGSVETVVTIGSDLLAEAPESWGMSGALGGEHGPLLVSLASGRDTTSEAANWVLPIQTDLERQQFSFPTYGKQDCNRLTLHVADPVVAARGAARHPLEVLYALSIAAEVDLGAVPLDMASTRASVVDAVVELAGKSPKSVLRSSLRGDGRLAVRGAACDPLLPVARFLKEPSVAEVHTVTNASADEQEVGDPQAFSLRLFEGVRGEATGWQRPWLAELPDPVSSVMWGSWVEMHPQDAVRLDVMAGQLVRLTSAHGSLTTTAFVHPANRPGTLNMPVGRFDAEQEGGGDPRNVLGLSAMAGSPIHAVEVTLSAAVSEDLDPSPIFGRGLHRAEKIPAGWKSHGASPIAGSGRTSLPIVEDSSGQARARSKDPVEKQT